MTRPPTSPATDAPPLPAGGTDARLLELAPRLPAFLFELRYRPGAGTGFLYLGDAIRGILDVDPDTAITQPERVWERVPPEDLHRMGASMARCARERTTWQDEFRVLRADGRDVWLSASAHPTVQDEGVVLWYGWFLDVTERKRAQLALADSEERHRRLFDANPIPMWVHDRLTLRFLTVNEAAIARYGWTREEFLARTLIDLRAPDPEDAARPDASDPANDGLVRPTAAFHRLRDGRVIEVELTSQPITWNERPARMVMAVDVTERRRAEAEIQRLAYYDTLTGLPNRRLLADRLRQSIAAGVRTARHGAVLCIDLDDFKRVNDTRGHPVGDEVLVEAAARLKGCLRTEDTVARVGGDEFVVVLERLAEDPRQAAAQADETAHRLMTALSRPFDLPGMRFHSSASIGVVMFGATGAKVEDVLMHGDSAMYRAKAAGRGTVRFYDPAMQVALQARAALESDLRRALSEGQLRLAYQSQVDAAGRTVGAEVLLRWQHPERGPVPPMDFIPLAEETGLIVPIGQWVLETACMQLAGWARRPDTRTLRLSVNVSARQFRQPDFVNRVERALSDGGADPSRLRLELTESLLLDNINDCIAKMQSLKSIGVGFALDDFGTGYSSLSYLKRLPLDELKIDRSFIRDIATDPSDAVIVQTIIGMASNLGLEVIAEGVESSEQLEFLTRHGCTGYQGWLFGRAVSLPEFEASLTRTAAPPATGAARSGGTGGHVDANPKPGTPPATATQSAPRVRVQVAAPPVAATAGVPPSAR
jgi:diguanylate cyclase (GGDEF)-like protein/PAS domain S-box-containing protein